jgi:hypothetical protein
MIDGFEFICKACNGTGRGHKLSNEKWTWCIYCAGQGRLNWIENVVGKKYPFVASGTIRYNYNLVTDKSKIKE